MEAPPVLPQVNGLPAANCSRPRMDCSRISARCKNDFDWLEKKEGEFAINTKNFSDEREIL
jgi:hypothetical protein